MSPDQAQLLAMLVQIHGAEKCIEVGVYTVCIPSHSNLTVLLSNRTFPFGYIIVIYTNVS